MDMTKRVIEDSHEDEKRCVRGFVQMMGDPRPKTPCFSDGASAPL
jgi:hypothetical protein